MGNTFIGGVDPYCVVYIHVTCVQCTCICVGYYNAVGTLYMYVGSV